MAEAGDVGKNAVSARYPNWVMWVVAGAAVVGLVGVGAWFALGSGNSENDAATTTTTVAASSGLPEPSAEVAAATREYLAGDGQALLVMHDAAVETIADPDVLTTESCSATATRLDDGASADLVLGVTGGVSDSVLTSLFYTERTRLGVTLTTCVNGGDVADLVGELAATVELIDMRLVELEVTR